MAITLPTEDFRNPLVKQIIFEIKYPQLFSIENKIGDFQLKIVEKFPKSSLLFRKQVVFADIGPDVKIEDFGNNIDKGFSKKIWQFTSERGQINVSTSDVLITTTKIKKYSSDEDFRYLLEYILGNFFSVMPISILDRIGLRYINNLNVNGMSDRKFDSLINSSLSFPRFSLSSSQEMYCKVIKDFQDQHLIYQEALRNINNEKTWVLDLDISTKNKLSENYLSIADSLHVILKEEFFKTIKRSIYPLMRRNIRR